MIRVLSCVFEDHNLLLVLLAAIICVSACASTFFVLDNARNAEGPARKRWVFLAAALAGIGTWATHFVAMLGYNAGQPIGYDISETLLSAVICVIGAWVALEMFDRYESQLMRIGAGIVLGGAIVTMHFVGMMGVAAAADRIWAFDLIAAALLLSAAFAVAALHAFATLPAGFKRGAVAAGLLLLAIVSLHFTAMGALTLLPNPTLPAPQNVLNPELLSVVIAAVVTGLMMVAVVLTLADRRVTSVELAAAKQTAAMARHDALTGLPNRRHLFETLAERLSTRKDDETLAVIAIDLDRFKPVNDLYGHAVGDELLVRIARLLTDEAGEHGFVARLGGDEFTMVLPYQSVDTLIERMSALVKRFDAPIKLSQHEASVGATLGVALAPADGDDVDNLLRRADAALYRGKDDGRGRFAFFEAGMDARAHERALLEHDLRLAIRNDEIVPHFQSLVHLESGRVNGYEILARWTHPVRGAISPDVFIRIAEQTGMIGELTFNILRRACIEALHWNGAPPLSLNISPVQLQDAALPQKILRTLGECGFPAGRLEIEITEDALVGDFEAARAVLLSLKNIGIRIALDDFGTGYSSLRHLRELPFDSLKIDRSFISSMGESEESRVIVRTVVQLAKNLGLGVTAEGIETSAQVAALHDLGCDRGQGYLLGRPCATGVDEDAAKISAA